jgi:hypothetical protein
MGQLFEATGGEQDLVFDFLIAGQSNAMRGVVLYVSLGLTGDYNDDGVVDAADYTVWRNTLGEMVAVGSGADGNRDGTVGPEDYDVWKTNFGASTLSSGSSARNTPVPEPATIFQLIWLAWILATSAPAGRRRRP